MKKITILSLFLVFSFPLVAQTTAHLVLFNENNQPFIVLLNGRRVNDRSAKNLKITGLMGGNYDLKVIYNNTALGSFTQQLMVAPGHEVMYSLRRDAAGHYLEFISEFSLEYAPVVPEPQVEVVFADMPPDPVVITGGVPAGGTTTTTGGTTTTTTTTGGTTSGGTGGVSVNINLGGTGVAVQETTSTTTTTTTTTTTGGEPVPVIPVPVTPAPPPNPLPGYNGPIGCDWPMEWQDYESIKASVESKSFESTKFDVAKQALNGRCILTSQITDMMRVFSFESTKLDFAKWAWHRTYDKGNYYKVNDAFTFSSTIDDLNEYLEANR